MILLNRKLQFWLTDFQVWTPLAWIPRFKPKWDSAGLIALGVHYGENRFCIQFLVEIDHWQWGQGDYNGYFESWGIGPLLLVTWTYFDDPETEFIKDVMNS